MHYRTGGMEKNSGTIDRTKILGPVKRVVVKAGSGILTGQSGLNSRVINKLTAQICDLREMGIETIIVSSGAISSGLKKVGLEKRPESISRQQALAAVGQSSLMMAYERAFDRRGKTVAQILITRDDLNHRRRYLNARNTVFTLLSWGIIPIINENDTVVVDEIKFGDNDNLSAMVASMTESQLLINLTDMDGLFDKDPRIHPDARIIRVIHRVDSDVMRYAGSIPGFLGTGGMASKVKAARNATLGGIPVIIANGRRQNVLRDIFNGKEIGTLFTPQDVALCGRKCWIAFTKAPKGTLHIDHGASEALRKKGKSLLPSGITGVAGRFGLGDSAILRDEEDREIAIGLVNYSSGAIKRIMGLKSNEIESVLGYKFDDEVVHRDNLVILESMSNGEETCQ